MRHIAINLVVQFSPSHIDSGTCVPNTAPWGVVRLKDASLVSKVMIFYRWPLPLPETIFLL